MKTVKKTEYPTNILTHIIKNDDSKEVVDMSDFLQGEQLIIALEKMCATLTPKEQIVMSLRYKEKQTYCSIGKKLGVGAARIRVISEKALRKLRYPKRFRALYGQEITLKEN